MFLGVSSKYQSRVFIVTESKYEIVEFNHLPQCEIVNKTLKASKRKPRNWFVDIAVGTTVCKFHSSKQLPTPFRQITKKI